MAKLTQFVSDVLLGKVGSSDLGYNTEEVTVTISGAMIAGASLGLVGGKYIWSTIATKADSVAVLVDEKALEGHALAAGDHTLKVAKRGVTVNKAYFNLSDEASGANVDAAVAAFEAAGANKVTAKVEA